jgi:hypothetical protein
LGIGDGSSTRIETDNWIPGASPVLLKSQVPLLENQMVSTLILEHTRYWDVDLIRTIFPEDVVTQVLQVPISCHSGEDFASWPYTRFGCYTLGSGCNLGRTDNFSDRRLRMAILPTGTGTRGYRARMGRVWAHFYAHG